MVPIELPTSSNGRQVWGSHTRWALPLGVPVVWGRRPPKPVGALSSLLSSHVSPGRGQPLHGPRFPSCEQRLLSPTHADILVLSPFPAPSGGKKGSTC